MRQNWGDTLIEWHGGPRDLQSALTGRGFNPNINRNTVSGIVFVRSQIRDKDISDGLSKTFLVGEIGLNSNHYSESYTAYEGAGNPYSMGWIATTHYRAWRDRPEFPYINLFGSSHPGGWLVAMCDGSVRSVEYDIDATTHRQMGNRSDGLAVDGG